MHTHRQKVRVKVQNIPSGTLSYEHDPTLGLETPALSSDTAGSICAEECPTYCQVHQGTFLEGRLSLVLEDKAVLNSACLKLLFFRVTGLLQVLVTGRDQVGASWGKVLGVQEIAPEELGYATNVKK